MVKYQDQLRIPYPNLVQSIHNVPKSIQQVLYYLNLHLEFLRDQVSLCDGLVLDRLVLGVESRIY